MVMNICNHWALLIFVGNPMPKNPIDFVELDKETRSHVGTNTAAVHLMRAQNTLRIWAMGRTAAPVTPIRINGRLAWPVEGIRRALGVK